MNTYTRTAAVTTDDLPRRRWTIVEVEQMVAAGIVRDDERIELINGELVAMSPKGRRHEIVRHALAFQWIKQCPEHVRVAVEPALRLDQHQTPEPDIILHSAHLVAPDVRGDTALLVVEVADSSYNYDLKIKAPLYAAFGVAEYWVIDARTLVTTVHRQPGADGYADVREVSSTEVITPVAVPALAISLATLMV